MTASALELIDNTIAELEARLNLKPGEDVQPQAGKKTINQNQNQKAKKKGGGGGGQEKKKQPQQKNAAPNLNQPEVCKLEFKVGKITKVWKHEKADKLYCEEIDVGEETPRQIASGLRPHFTEEQMLGQKLLVVSNLKAKNLVGFKSHGMVLCAAGPHPDDPEKEVVEFVEPPDGAEIGEVVTFDGLPHPEPLSAAQVEKRKVFAAAMPGMKTTEDCVAAWEGHKFMTSAGPCLTKTVKLGCLR